MKARQASQGFSVGRVLMVITMLLACLVALLSYDLLGRGQVIQRPDSLSTSFKMTQLAADVRTVAAAISYLLYPETPNEHVA